MAVPTSSCAPAAAPPDRVLFASPIVTVGAFRCGVEHPLFRDSGPIGNACFVFPRTAVAIAHDGEPPFVADPTLITLYNRGDRYERRAVSPEGDRCDWFGVAPVVQREALAARAPSSVGAADGNRFPRSWAPTTPDLYLDQRRLFVDIAEDRLDPLEIEERVLSLLQRVTHLVRDASPAAGSPDSAAARRRRALVAEASRMLGRRFREPLTLDALAADLACSAFHLCRVFRRHTGRTLHRHLTELRLRAALELMETGADLTSVALESGYSSHSHFTAAFSDTFHMPPSRALRRRRASKNPVASSRTSD